MKHIAIAGNIGAGKTTLTSRLAEHFGWTAKFEVADSNPYLSDFYHDMKSWSFHLQIFFLNSRFNQALEIQKGTHPTILDRTVYEDAYIFAPNLVELGLLTQRDYNNYFELFLSIYSVIPPPDLLIYLKADIPTLVDHIEQRGREYEGNISLDYLRRLNKRYDSWIKTYKDGPVLVIDLNTKDLKNNISDFESLVKDIEDIIKHSKK